ncbi:MAG: AMP-binding protein [Pseudomonadales bacterium]
MSDNLYEQLQSAMDRHSDKVALRLDSDRVVHFAELSTRVGQVSAGLQAQGVVPGDRILVQVNKSVANLVLYLATLRVGAVYVPINTAYTLEEVRYFIEDAEPVLLVVDEPAAYGPLATLLAEGGAKLIAVGRYPEDGDPTATPALVTDGVESADGAVVARSSDDIAAILYTSGTTGRSKGAMLTHGNLSTNAHTLLSLWGWQEDDVLLHALPIFHVHGLFVALHCALLGGSTTVFRPAFDLDDVLRWLPGCTVMMGVPTFYTRLLGADRFDRVLCQSMRLFISGSAPLTEQTFEAFEARTGHRILERYGMSETLMNTSNPYLGERVPGTVGYALPEVEARVVNEQGQSVEPGEVGVIEVRGPNVFPGYWRMPEKTQAEFRTDGFFVTGDLGTMAADGRIAIVGREKDLVISGGYNVYPKEIERLLDELPEIVESAVIGVPHADFGEAVVAVVVPVDPQAPLAEERLREFLQDRLARYKQPKQVVNVEELPRNAMGKVQKNTLRKRYEALLSD